MSRKKVGNCRIVLGSEWKPPTGLTGLGLRTLKTQGAHTNGIKVNWKLLFIHENFKNADGFVKIMENNTVKKLSKNCT